MCWTKWGFVQIVKNNSMLKYFNSDYQEAEKKVIK